MEKPDYFNPQKIKNTETKRAMQQAEKKLMKDLKERRKSKKMEGY